MSQPAGARPTKGTIGAISELRACAYLMAKGSHVFRAESPSCPIDLIAYDGTRCIRVEVKTLSAHPKYPEAITYGKPRNDEWDLLIVVAQWDGTCFEYHPGCNHTENLDSMRAHFGFSPRRVGGRTCEIQGCDGEHQARGLCLSHYNRFQRERRRGRYATGR